MSQLMMQLVMSCHVLHTRYATTSPTTSPSLTPTLPLTPPCIFLEGEHSFDITDLVQVNNVHNLKDSERTRSVAGSRS